MACVCVFTLNLCYRFESKCKHYKLSHLKRSGNTFASSCAIVSPSKCTSSAQQSQRQNCCSRINTPAPNPTCTRADTSEQCNFNIQQRSACKRALHASKHSLLRSLPVHSSSMLVALEPGDRCCCCGCGCGCCCRVCLFAAEVKTHASHNIRYVEFYARMHTHWWQLKPVLWTHIAHIHTYATGKGRAHWWRWHIVERGFAYESVDRYIRFRTRFVQNAVRGLLAAKLAPHRCMYIHEQIQAQGGDMGRSWITIKLAHT